jgi:hypothetical protein
LKKKKKKIINFFFRFFYLRGWIYRSTARHITAATAVSTFLLLGFLASFAGKQEKNKIKNKGATNPMKKKRGLKRRRRARDPRPEPTEPQKENGRKKKEKKEYSAASLSLD